MSRILVLIALLFPGAALAQLEYNTITDGGDRLLMMRGKDPVSYFQGAEPVAGNPDIKAEHDGVTYRFASEENRKGTEPPINRPTSTSGSSGASCAARAKASRDSSACCADA